MKKIIIPIFILFVLFTKAQKPILYIQLVSHNEPKEDFSSTIGYTKGKTNALTMANLVVNKKVKWNLQSSDGFILGALADQAKTQTNIFSTLAGGNYVSYIQIDPRNKNSDGRNIADQYHLLDSLGANPSTILGGFVYATKNSTSIDWEQYKEPITGAVYKKTTWQCTLISGAGSSPPHDNDLNDFGIFKPNNATDFYTHTESNNLWNIGQGCAPLLDSTANEQAIIDLIQGQVDSIQNGLWPENKFYVTRIMTNQIQYGPMFFTKLTKVLDSLALIPDTQLKWATIGETFTAFETWRKNSGNLYSQWLCGQEISTGNDELNISDPVVLFPNPTSENCVLIFNDNEIHNIQVYDGKGNNLLNQVITGSTEINTENWPTGVYMIRIDSELTKKLIKE